MSSDPYNFPPTFVGLLSSQQDPTTTPVTYPLPSTQLPPQHVHFTTSFSHQHVQPTYQTYSQPISSQPSGYSSQPVTFSSTYEPEDFVDLGVDDIQVQSGRARRDRWTSEEDVILISAWLNTSKDPVVGNDQNSDCFWQRVTDCYQANEGATIKRSLTKCRSRWGRINHQTNKFVGCLSQATRNQRSGQSDDDVLTAAQHMYVDDMKNPFNLFHCWKELKDEQKWKIANKIDVQEPVANKRAKHDAEGTYSSSSNTNGTEMRPPGVKASKRKGKKTVGSDSVESSSDKVDKIVAMKDKEQEAKAHLGKMRLLDRLMSKGDLSPNEIILKDKLLEQMLSNI